MKEIGSEFWRENSQNNYDNNLDFLKIGKDYKLLMSGRGAIDYILDEIKDNKKIVYMPNYCCESMVIPFENKGYQIKFYNVDVMNNKYDIDIDEDYSIFYAMSYFGYNVSNMDNYIERISEKNKIIIEDITHRFLCKKNYCSKSDYLICSLRKWFPIVSGGLVINVKEDFKNSIDSFSVNIQYIKDRFQAMDLKNKYMNDEIIDKDKFLKLYNSSNKLIEDYKNKKIDEASIMILKALNIEEIKARRIENCKLIESKIKSKKYIKLLYEYKEGDCPLFVPITIKNRDDIRKALIDKNIYLPIHWPNDFKINNTIYDIELSLVNDQRYSREDINKYIDTFLEITGDMNEVLCYWI